MNSYAATFINLMFAGWFLSACGNANSAEDASTTKGTLPNGNNTDLRIGSGLNSLTGETKDRCIVFHDDDDLEVTDLTSQLVNFQVRKIESLEELRDTLRVSASAAFNSGFYRASTQASYFRARAMSEFTSYLAVNVTVENATRSLKAFQLTDAAKDLLASNPVAFTQACGDEFVAGMTTGGEFIAIVEFLNRNREEKENIEAAIKAAGGSWRVATDFERSMEKLSKLGSVNIDIFKNGGHGQLPAIENLVAHAREFPGEVAQAGHPWIHSWITKPYAATLDAQGAPDFAMQQRYLEDAARTVALARQRRNTAEFMLNHKERFPEQTTKEWSAIEKAMAELDDILNRYNEQTLACFENPAEGCIYDSVVLPALPLPSPKADVLNGDQKCQMVRNQVYEQGHINLDDWGYFTKINWAPFFRVPHNPASGISGWTECSVVASSLKV